jgi:hypothetical protein
LLRWAVIELGEITPYRLLRGIGGIGRVWRDDIAARVAGKPMRPAGDELAVFCGVVDDEIHDHPQPVIMSGVGKPAQQPVVVARLAAAETGIEPVLVLDGVKASGKTRIVKRIDIDSVETHRRDPRQMFCPLPDRSGQCRK